MEDAGRNAGPGGHARGSRAASREARGQSTRSAARRQGIDPASITEQSLLGEIGLEDDQTPVARPSHGRTADVHWSAGALPEKEKVSITLDRLLVDEIRAQFSGRALSSTINELLHGALAQRRLADLVAQMEQEAGPSSPEAYERVLAQWFAED